MILRHALGPAAIGAVTVAVYVWAVIDVDGVFDALGAYRSALYQQPWRAVTSGFIHDILPHLLFNLITLAVFGYRVAQRVGSGWFFAIFFISLIVGQVAHTLAGPGSAYALSGGVCGLYGFLLGYEWRSSLGRTMRSWFGFWLYPLLLLLLAILDRLGVIPPVADLNHVVGIAMGLLLAAGRRGRNRRYYNAAAATLTTVALVLTVLRPWDPIWRAIYGPVDPSTALPRLDCDEPFPLPGPEVISAPPLQVTLLNPARHELTISYYNPEGALIETFEFSLRARSFRPLTGSVWLAADAQGACVARFHATRDGVLPLPLE